MLPTKFRFIWPSDFSGEEIFRRKRTRIAYGGYVYVRIRTKWAIFVEDLLYMLPTKDKFIWQFQRRFLFRNQPIRNKNCLWRPCLFSDRDKMSNLYRGPPIDASYQVSVHLAKWFHRRFLKLTNQKKKIAYGSHVC